MLTSYYQNDRPLFFFLCLFCARSPIYFLGSFLLGVDFYCVFEALLIPRDHTGI